MGQSNTVSVRGAHIECSDEGRGKFRQLYVYQLQTVESVRSVIVLDAPTGSGKTLAALARVLEKQSPAIFIYPTNTLVKDQVTSMKKLLSELDRSVNVIDGGAGSDWPKPPGDTDIDLIHLTGETLGELSGKAAKGSTMDQILTGTHKADRMRILLTNPDTMYLAFAGRYHRHGRITEQLYTFRTLVVDEFHLYSGPTLARVLFMLNAIRTDPENSWVDLLFLSATHGDTHQLLRNTYPELDIISVEALDEGGQNRRQVRYETRSKLRTQSRVMLDEEDAEQAATDIVSFYQTEMGESTEIPDVKVLGVFSSVTFAMRVAEKVQEQLSSMVLEPNRVVRQIHGLIPKQKRPRLEDLKNAIVIGTSAVEVGIDFDVPFLVMEAHDLAAFLQRFGRGGRHQECTSILYLPQPMVDRCRKRASWSFAEFIEQAKETFRELPSYADFMCSPQARVILLAMALAGSVPAFSGRWGKEFNIDLAIDAFLSIVESNRTVKVSGPSLIDVIGSLDPRNIELDLGHRNVKVLARHGFLRGTMNSVLVGYDGATIGLDGGMVYAEMDIFVLFKLQGHIEPAAKHWQWISPEVRHRHSREEPLFIVDSFHSRDYPRATLLASADHRRSPFVYSEPEIHIRFSSGEMNNVAQSILEGRNLAYHWFGLTKLQDYRIPRIYMDGEPGGLVIGDWALLAKYLTDKRRKEDEKL